MPEFIDAEIIRTEPQMTQMTQTESRDDGEAASGRVVGAALSVENRQSKIENRLSSPLSSLDSLLIRPGTLDDLAFIDKLQKQNSRAVGFFPTQALEGKIKLGHVLVAEASGQCSVISGQGDASSLTTGHSPLTTIPVGYLIGNDQYFKRDDVGCIFQINVVPVYRRSLVAAMLLRAQFERSSWGCKLYCCWCAQDLEANRFWEAIGFVPLAFRTGSARRSDAATKRRSDEGNPSVASSLRRSAPSARIHIFWQKRIRQGDESTPWWFPCKTGGGSLREDRIVLPIPPGTRWEEAMPVLLPGQTVESGQGSGVSSSVQQRTKANRSSLATTRLSSPKSGHSSPTTAEQRPSIRCGGMWSAAAVKVKKPKRKHIHDPALVQRARELRDRWLEQMNENPNALLPRPKYEVGRMLPPIDPPFDPPMRQLAA